MEPMVHLTLAESGSDRDRLDQLTRLLRDELSHLDTVDVRRASSHAAPPGARGVDAQTVSTLGTRTPCLRASFIKSAPSV